MPDAGDAMLNISAAAAAKCQACDIVMRVPTGNRPPWRRARARARSDQRLPALLVYVETFEPVALPRAAEARSWGLSNTAHGIAQWKLSADDGSPLPL